MEERYRVSWYHQICIATDLRIVVERLYWISTMGSLAIFSFARTLFSQTYRFYASRERSRTGTCFRDVFTHLVTNNPFPISSHENSRANERPMYWRESFLPTAFIDMDDVPQVDAFCFRARLTEAEVDVICQVICPISFFF